MKKLSSDLYIVEPNEAVTIRIEAVNTLNLVTISLDGQTIQLQEGLFDFRASPEKGTTHILVFVFTFAGGEQATGSYQVNLKGSAGGTSKFSVELSSSQPVNSLVRMFRVGSAEEEKLGIDPPSPWPHG